MPTPYLTHISDTARWVAVMRGRESARPDALFHDPLAMELAGIEGDAIATVMRLRRGMPDWPIVIRTVVLDEIIARCVAGGVDMVVNLAAGLDTRPYRMPLPKTLTWVEVDLPDITAYKTAALAGHTPNCTVERIVTDLADADARRKLFAELGARARNALVITEGLLVYLTDEQVQGIARDLHAVPTFRHWVAELMSAALLPRMQKTVGKELAEAGMPMQWGTAEGPAYFHRFGWREVEVRSMFAEAGKRRRLDFPLNVLYWLLPLPKQPWKGPWSGIVLFERAEG